MLSLGCAGVSAKSDATVSNEKCFTLENRTNIPVRMALCRENGDFFFAEVLKPLEIRKVCEEEVGLGNFIFCWQPLTTMDLECQAFTVTEKHTSSLYDDKVDLWVAPRQKLGT